MSEFAQDEFVILGTTEEESVDTRVSSLELKFQDFKVTLQADMNRQIDDLHSCNHLSLDTAIADMNRQIQDLNASNKLALDTVMADTRYQTITICKKLEQIVAEQAKIQKFASELQRQIKSGEDKSAEITRKITTLNQHIHNNQIEVDNKFTKVEHCSANTKKRTQSLYDQLCNVHENMMHMNANSISGSSYMK